MVLRGHGCEFQSHRLQKALVKSEIDVFRARTTDWLRFDFHCGNHCTHWLRDSGSPQHRIPRPQHRLHPQKRPTVHLSGRGPRRQVCQRDYQVPHEANPDQVLLLLRNLLRVCLHGSIYVWREDQLWRLQGVAFRQLSVILLSHELQWLRQCFHCLIPANGRQQLVARCQHVDWCCWVCTTRSPMVHILLDHYCSHPSKYHDCNCTRNLRFSKRWCWLSLEQAAQPAVALQDAQRWRLRQDEGKAWRGGQGHLVIVGRSGAEKSTRKYEEF